MKENFMSRAIALAKLGSGFVNPDPLSGAVLVKDNQIIHEEHYRACGSTSAEESVLELLENNLNGLELYLNIEPFRKDVNKKKLAEKMKSKGIQKVYVGMEDTNPSKVEKFAEELQKVDIEYEYGLLSEECKELNEIYDYFIRRDEPFVFVKWAMTLDGKLATRTGDSKWISSEDSLRFVHYLRQRVAAIMVGENTVRKDDPLLTTRLEGVEISNPLRVVLSKYGDLPLDSKVLQVNQQTKTLVIASEFISKEREKVLLQKGVQVRKLPEKNQHIDFKDIMKLLGSMGIDSLYIEGGSAILGSAFESGVVHKVYTAIAPKIVGGMDAVTPVGGKGIEFMRDALVLTRVSHEIVGPDVIIKGYLK